MKNNIFKVLILLILIADTTYAKSKKHLDLATFQEIDSLYSKDKNGVYINGSRKKIEGLDPYTFQVLNNYIKDKNGVYYIYDYGDKPKAERIPYMDGNTFEEMDQLYSRDKNNIYYKRERIKGVDINTFEKIDEYIYSRDKNNVYYRGKKIEGADRNSFEKIDKYSYSKDKNNIYFEEKKIEGVDRDTFEQIDDEVYSKDKNNIYYKNIRLEGIDKDTFEKVYKLVDDVFVKDKNGIYIVENDGNLVSVNDEEVDWKSFVRLVIGTNIYQDKNNMYFIKNHKLEKIKNAPEVDDYNLYIYNDRYINKYNTVYYLDTDNSTFKKVIKARLNDFRVLDEEYAKGKENVYFRGQILKEADYSSFDIKYNEQIEAYEIRDKNKVYKIVRK